MSRRRYAVVDCARDARLYDAVHRCFDPYCLLAGDLPAVLQRVSPWLVPLDDAEPLLALWRREGRDGSWGVFLETSRAPATVLRRLRQLLQAQAPDGRPVLFRFYDPRVLRAYLAQADAQARAQVLGLTDRILAESDVLGGVDASL
ncbi:DUF4123 domain-containing protein [Prosthecomicrobium sp. N25]|uniref:DUF4123 domain-containing protein n=1 Tax=Prosthecomicrobium sp. N25 TaxID=3129254 RepID=UPI00307737E3